MADAADMGQNSQMSETNRLVYVKLDQLADENKVANQKIEEISKQLLDPENGVFSKVKENETHVRLTEEKLDRLATSCERLIESQAANQIQIEKLATWSERHEALDDEMRADFKGFIKSMTPMVDDFKHRKETDKWKSKLIWLVLSTLIVMLLGGIVSFGKYLLFDLPKERQKMETIEQLIRQEASHKHGIHPASEYSEDLNKSGRR